MQEIYKDGTTQEVFFDAVSADPELGAEDSEHIQTIVMLLSK